MLINKVAIRLKKAWPVNFYDRAFLIKSIEVDRLAHSLIKLTSYMKQKLASYLF